MAHRLLLLIILLFPKSSIRCQDVLLNQFMRCAIYTNPALTGTGRDSLNNPGGRLSSLYRNQWSLPTSNPYTTNYLSYDQVLSDGFGSFGGYFIYDAAGKNGAFQTTQFNATYAYTIPIVTQQSAVRFGMSLGYKNQGVDLAKLRFEDQIDFTRGVVINTSEVLQSARVSNADINVGAVYYNRSQFFGVSVHNVNKPTFNFLGSIENVVNRRFGVIYGVTKINNQSVKAIKVFKFNSAFYIQDQNTQLNMAVYVGDKNLSLGIGARFCRSFEFATDAAVATLVYNLKNFDFYYGFEYTTSKLRTFAPVSHEVGMQIPISISKYFKQQIRTFGTLNFPN